jgi:hypothetical protein
VLCAPRLNSQTTTATKTTNKLRVTKPNQAPPHTEEELEALVAMGAEAD